VADHPTRRLLLAGLAAAPASAFAAGGSTLKIKGRFEQGGHAIVHTRPGASFALDGETLGEASRGGWFIIGFDRDAAPETLLTVKTARKPSEHRFEIAGGNFDVQKIDGLPDDQVTPEDPALLARIAEEAKRKAIGFASKVDADWFKDGFDLPLKAIRVSSRFGGQRILNGVPSRPHYGADLAAPVGTPVHAPAAGVVSFAETGLHYEGGLILIDHGQGLISAYLHLSRVDVRAGQSVKRGELIGAVGQEGRATGPHLCWRLKWRGRNLDPTLLVAAASAKT
jgi:murein DD-endopeptidase MepM/ murein hydrolase activator NlpD